MLRSVTRRLITIGAHTRGGVTGRASYSSIPFDTVPFPFSRFEPCCPEAESASDNGFVPCKQHPIPNVIGRKVEIHEDFSKAAQARHMVVCVGPQGPEWSRSKVEAVQGGIVSSVNTAMNDWLRHQEHRTSGGDPSQLLVTVCDRTSETPWPACDVLLFPDFCQYTAIRPEDMKGSSFSNTLEALWKDPGVSKLPQPQDRMTPLEDTDTVILVCTHTMRDKRCGVLGPLLVDEFKRVLSERKLLKETGGKVEVWGTSHVGGMLA